MSGVTVSQESILQTASDDRLLPLMFVSSTCCHGYGCSLEAAQWAL